MFRGENEKQPQTSTIGQRPVPALPPKPDPLQALVLAVTKRMTLVCEPSCTGAECEHLCSPNMVPLLAYCYASGMLCSDDIEASLLHDSSLGLFLRQPKWPSSAGIRCFRKRHFPEIKRCLAEVIESARANGIALDASAPRAWACLTDPQEEAQLRLTLATHLDSAELDD